VVSDFNRSLVKIGGVCRVWLGFKCLNVEVLKCLWVYTFMCLCVYAFRHPLSGIWRLVSGVSKRFANKTSTLHLVWRKVEAMFFVSCELGVVNNFNPDSFLALAFA
jgi:hypothetical protein